MVNLKVNRFSRSDYSNQDADAQPKTPFGSDADDEFSPPPSEKEEEFLGEFFNKTQMSEPDIQQTIMKEENVTASKPMIENVFETYNNLVEQDHEMFGKDYAPIEIPEISYEEPDELMKSVIAKAQGNARKAKSGSSKKGKKSVNSFFDYDDQILGADKRLLLKKIQQYKVLFPEETKKLNPKNGASVEDLQLLLDEMETIVQVNSMDKFMVDSILHCLSLIESVSSRIPRYDISGMVEALKANPEFHRLAKLLFIKYGTFVQCPIEAQMIFLVSTTAYFCNARNRKKAELEIYLNQPVSS